MCCKDCPYHWREKDEKYPCCHFVGPEGWAPCEQEEFEEEDKDDE